MFASQAMAEVLRSRMSQGGCLGAKTKASAAGKAGQPLTDALRHALHEAGREELFRNKREAHEET